MSINNQIKLVSSEVASGENRKNWKFKLLIKIWSNIGIIRRTDFEFYFELLTRLLRLPSYQSKDSTRPKDGSQTTEKIHRTK